MASAGSCTTATPPQRLIARSPAVDADHAAAKGGGGRTEQWIDSRSREVLARTAAQQNMAVMQQQMLAGRGHVNVAQL
jgi:hypothetical protein